MNDVPRPILVIDADPMWRDFCHEALTRFRYLVYAAPTVAEVLDLAADDEDAAAAPALVDALIVEENPATLSVLVGEGKGPRRTVYVAFATEVTPDRARAAYKRGASDCVGKPYDEGSLVALVEQIFADQRLAVPQRTVTRRPGPSAILIVEDDPAWQASLVDNLPPVDEVVTAADYASAVEQLKGRSFDLVVADLRLVDAELDNFQGMDLIRLLRQLDKERDTFAAAIIVSAYGTTEHIREAYRTLRVYYYFDKRYFVPAKYRQTVQDALPTSTD
jgi:DNA-binding NtrC family response regulator